MRPEQLRALASDPEVMAMLRNPRMQEVLREVRKGVGGGITKADGVKGVLFMRAVGGFRCGRRQVIWR
jgi:hypothetical protein